MNSNKEHITNQESTLPLSLQMALAEVEETVQLVRSEIAETIDLLPQPDVLQDSLQSQFVVQNLLYQLLECVCQVLKVDTAAVLLWTGDNKQQLSVRAARGLEEEVMRGIRVPVGRGFAGNIAAQREVAIVEDLSKIEVFSPILRNKGLQSMLGVPLLNCDGQIVGVFHVGTFDSRRFNQEDAKLLEIVAERISSAINQLAFSRNNQTIALLPILQVLVNSLQQKLRVATFSWINHHALLTTSRFRHSRVFESVG